MQRQCYAGKRGQQIEEAAAKTITGSSMRREVIFIKSGGSYRPQVDKGIHREGDTNRQVGNFLCEAHGMAPSTKMRGQLTDYCL